MKKRTIAILAAGALLLISMLAVSCAADDLGFVIDTVAKVNRFFVNQYNAGALGPVLKASKTEAEDTEGGKCYIKTVKYDGVEMQLWCESPKFKRNVTCAYLTITKNKWRLPNGIAIGMSRSAIEKTLRKDKGFYIDGDNHSDGVYNYTSSLCDSTAKINIKYRGDKAVQMELYFAD